MSCSLNTLLTKLFVAFTKIIHHAFYHLHSRRLIEVNSLREKGVKVVSTFGQNKRTLHKPCICMLTLPLILLSLAKIWGYFQFEKDCWLLTRGTLIVDKKGELMGINFSLDWNQSCVSYTRTWSAWKKPFKIKPHPKHRQCWQVHT